MNVESVVWDVRGGLPDFDDFELVENAAVEFTADTVEQVTVDE